MIKNTKLRNMLIVFRYDLEKMNSQKKNRKRYRFKF